ncbi:uncharacterized protein G2W53_017665 [Senna tora]|uniref:Uncharacterized protein n=1 Tax=Senna tora TaxID=362788 RepID=A0A834TTJ0_9FABA|nr:uncharacterized protein G2W53_017665 [Senna tora]
MDRDPPTYLHFHPHRSKYRERSEKSHRSEEKSHCLDSEREKEKNHRHSEKDKGKTSPSHSRKEKRASNGDSSYLPSSSPATGVPSHVEVVVVRSSPETVDPVAEIFGERFRHRSKSDAFGSAEPPRKRTRHASGVAEGDHGDSANKVSPDNEATLGSSNGYILTRAPNASAIEVSLGQATPDTEGCMSAEHPQEIETLAVLFSAEVTSRHMPGHRQVLSSLSRRGHPFFRSKGRLTSRIISRWLRPLPLRRRSFLLRQWIPPWHTRMVWGHWRVDPFRLHLSAYWRTTDAILPTCERLMPFISRMMLGRSTTTPCTKSPQVVPQVLEPSPLHHERLGEGSPLRQPKTSSQSGNTQNTLPRALGFHPQLSLSLSLSLDLHDHHL